MHATAAPAISQSAWEALQGAYDLQVHVAPDVIERRIDDLDLAKEFLAHGLRGFVLKSHYLPTAERAKVVSKAVPGIAAYGAITLNHSIGGLNPVAVELAGRAAAKSSGCPRWTPQTKPPAAWTGRRRSCLSGPRSSVSSRQRESRRPRFPWWMADGKLTEAARRCLELIGKYNMILATGHLGRVEIFALVKTAREMGLKRVLVTHAEFPSQNLTAGEQYELAEMGALIEHCFTTMHTGKASWEGVFEAIRKARSGALRAFDRPRANHQPAGRRGFRDVRAEVAGGRLHVRGNPPHGRNESGRARRVARTIVLRLLPVGVDVVDVVDRYGRPGSCGVEIHFLVELAAVRAQVKRPAHVLAAEAAF